MSLASRLGLPGADELFVAEFNRLMARADIEGSARMAAASPQGLLRTRQTIQRFQEMPAQQNQPDPLLQYFAFLLKKGKLNKLESLELARYVLQQGRGQLLEKWLTEDKLECSEELGDMVAQVDTTMALSIYLCGNVPDKVINCFVARGEFDKIVEYAAETGYRCDYTFWMQNLVHQNPAGSLDFAQKLATAPQGPLMEVNAIVDIFMQANRTQETTAFLLEVLKQDRAEDGYLQTRLLEINLIGGSPQVADAILSNDTFHHYDRTRIAELCENVGLSQRALEHRSELNDIKRRLEHMEGPSHEKERATFEEEEERRLEHIEQRNTKNKDFLREKNEGNLRDQMEREAKEKEAGRQQRRESEGDQEERKDREEVYPEVPKILGREGKGERAVTTSRDRLHNILQDMKSVFLNSEEFVIDVKSETLTGRNVIFACQPASRKREYDIIKFYPAEKSDQAQKEYDMMDFLYDDGKDYIAKPVKFSSDVTIGKGYHCQALVTERGRSNLLDLCTHLLGFEVPTLLQIARCMYYIHQKGHIYGDLKLENLVNFGEVLPTFKLVDFENCCPTNVAMAKNYSPEYCPPEMAELVLGKRGKLMSDYSYDVWCFGVLWLKLYSKGKTFIEFAECENAQAILSRIADPSFNFEKTLNQLHGLNTPAKTLIRKCLSRQPESRPAFKEILKHHVLVGHTTTLDEKVHISSQIDSMKESLHRIEEHTLETSIAVRSLENLVWESIKYPVPVLWVLTPWASTKSNNWMRKIKNSVVEKWELKMVCEGAFERDNMIKCASCPERYRISIQQPGKWIRNCVPVLRCTSVLLKALSLASKIGGVPGSGVLDSISNILSLQLDCSLMDNQLENMFNDASLSQLSQKVDDVLEQYEEYGSANDEIKRAATNVVEEAEHFRTYFASGDKRQLMMDLLKTVDDTKDWNHSPVIGGLVRVRHICGKDKGRVKWVCENHAEDHLAYER